MQPLGMYRRPSPRRVSDAPIATGSRTGVSTQSLNRRYDLSQYPTVSETGSRPGLQGRYSGGIPYQGSVLGGPLAGAAGAMGSITGRPSGVAQGVQGYHFNKGARATGRQPLVFPFGNWDKPGDSGGFFSIPDPSTQPLPDLLPGHPGYQPQQGPLATTLPQRAGMAVQGPVQLGGERPFGMTMPQPSGGGMLQNGLPRVFPGSGMGYYRDNAYNPSPQQRAIDDAGVARDRMYGAADPAGPYSGSAGMRHFGPLASSQGHVETPPPVGAMFGRSRVAEVDGRRVLFGPNASIGNYGVTPEGQAGARGRAGVFRDTIDENTLNDKNLAYAARADDRAAGLREGRRNRAIQKYGLTHLQPTQNYTYDSNIGAAGGYSRTAPYAPTFGGGPLANARPGAPTQPVSTQATGNFDDDIGMFSVESGDWSPDQKRSFIDDINRKRASDPKYAKKFQEWLDKPDYEVRHQYDGVTVQEYDDAELARINEVRAMYGKPPLTPKVVSDERGLPPQGYYGT